jgi:hypothetical protein
MRERSPPHSRLQNQRSPNAASQNQPIRGSMASRIYQKSPVHERHLASEVGSRRKDTSLSPVRDAFSPSSREAVEYNTRPVTKGSTKHEIVRVVGRPVA